MEYMSLGVLSGLQSCNYSASEYFRAVVSSLKVSHLLPICTVAALAFTMWDICITLDDEVGVECIFQVVWLC